MPFVKCRVLREWNRMRTVVVTDIDDTQWETQLPVTAIFHNTPKDSWFFAPVTGGIDDVTEITLPNGQPVLIHESETKPIESFGPALEERARTQLRLDRTGAKAKLFRAS
jgi:hypothetical protein